MTDNKLQLRSELQNKLASIDAKLSKLKANAEATWRTNGEFKYNPYSSYAAINIHRNTDLYLLMSILGYILSKKNEIETAAKVLELDNYPNFTWCGYDADSWEHDIKIRVSVITHHEKIQKLKQAKVKLQSFLTEEDKLAIVLKELEDIH